MLANLTAQITELVSEMDAVGFNLKFDLAGDGVIHVAAKEAPVVVSNTDGDAETTLKLSADNLQQLLDKRLSPTTAFMFGKIKIDGDMSNVMSLTSIFS
jgi:putative sterol carrier protein